MRPNFSYFTYAEHSHAYRIGDHWLMIVSG